MTWKDGSSYKGDWKKGLPNGIGIYLHYLGTFKVMGEKAKTGLF